MAYHYAICTDLTPTRATVDRVLTADEVLDEIEAGEIGDNEQALAVAPDSHHPGMRLWVEADDFVGDLLAHAMC